MCAAAGGAARVVITDGNPEVSRQCVLLQILVVSLSMLQAASNALMCTSLNILTGVISCDVHATQLAWGAVNCPAPLRGVADTVMCADCLFFEDFHTYLLETVDCLLKPGTSAEVC